MNRTSQHDRKYSNWATSTIWPRQFQINSTAILRTYFDIMIHSSLRCVSSMKHWKRLIRKSTWLRCNHWSGNFWQTHSPNINVCAWFTSDYRTGNSALPKPAICRHGPNNCFYCWHRIYWRATRREETIEIHWAQASRLSTINWICLFSELKRNVTNKRQNTNETVRPATVILSISIYHFIFNTTYT